VLAPFSGPVSKLLVSPGDQVKKGAPLALVDSPDFAAGIDAYRKALATARTNRRLADLDKDLLEHHGVAQREADQAETDATNAEADRDAALQALVSLQVDSQTIKDIDAGRPIAHPAGVIRAPIAGTVVEKLITPGELLPVSYTHLDVYKRQALRSSISCVHGFPCRCCMTTNMPRQSSRWRHC